MAARAKTSISKIFVWIVLLLLIVGLAGFGATSFGGSSRMLGSVGDTEISNERYFRALQQQIRSFEAETGQRLSFAEAQQYGLDRIVLQQIVALAALEDEAQDLNLSVGDEEVREEILAIPAFQGINGQFDRQAYEFALENIGQSVQDFEETLREETARTLLQGAVIAGIQPPAIFVDTLYDFARQTRDLSVARFTAADLETPVPAPTDEQIMAYYEANPDAYTLPERKRITFAWANPEMVVDAMSVTEEELRRVYEERSAEFDQPERRLVERLVFPNEDAAQAAADRIAAGEADFDDFVAERGLTLDDVDLGEVAQGDLGTAGETVFALDGPGVAGPADSNLGPALFRVNAVLAAQQVAFEDVADKLRAEVAINRARRSLEAEREPIEDLLAGGATIEEIAEESPLETGEILWSPDIASVDGATIDAYEEFRALAGQTMEGDFPELATLSDGGLVVLRVDEIVPPELQPLDDVEARVIQDWETSERQSRLADAAEAAREAVDGGAPLEDQAAEVTRQTGVLRDAFLEDLPQDLVLRAFALEEGGLETIESPDGAILVRVDAIHAPDPASEQAEQIRAGLTRQTGQGLAEDITSAFTTALQRQKGIEIDQSSVSAVNAQFN
ncbi:peptidyl-prolyl cis-trans isomerase D [Palleronia aestuarii]|uniref:Peptidyl-prolyl cis-trans isomerase D n=1 Tax=Palleronia aestuarii TaxID=568105 RepID=A0A2W7NK81_9RHOB|nr:peptidylprolyl isomerase [Palleronia aestuarii]PZX18497.1 peptidyl-prolyl cis-trans isomerase D [Palleronia aestuarii]